MRHKHEQHDFVFDPEPPYQIIESKYLSREELYQIEVVEHALEIYWNKKRAPHTLKYVTHQYGIFDFLLGLGLHFSQQRAFHHYTLPDVYRLLREYADAHYGHDPVLAELIAIDYCLQHKIKPATSFVSELPSPEKNKLLQARGLNPNKYRYIALPLSFDYGLFDRETVIAPGASTLIVQYSGTGQPVVV